MAPSPPDDKSTIHFSLLEAFARSGCPVCRRLQEHSTSYVDNLFYERVTDIGTRRKLRHARSLCNWHAWEASKMPAAALGVAIVAHDLLDEELTRLTALQRSSFSTRIGLRSGHHVARRALLTYLRAWRRRGICPACHVIVQHERYALETLLDCLSDAEGTERFRASHGLCLPHTVRALSLHPSHRGLGRLVEIQREKCAQLMAELEEFRRKHDYRFAGEAWESPSDACWRAIEMLAGKAAIYGSDLARDVPDQRPRVGLWGRIVSWLQQRTKALHGKAG